MRYYIIYNEEFKRTKENALHCDDTMKQFNNFDGQLYNGCHPDRLDEYEKIYKIGNQRPVSECSYNHEGHKFYESKKSCFYSHYSLWIKCLEFNEPIIILENDVYCSREFPINILTQMPEITHLAYGSVVTGGKRKGYGPVESVLCNEYKHAPDGINFFKDFELAKERGGYGMHGNMAYLIKPSAATKIIKDCQINGWMQNDRLMALPKCDSGILKPDIFTYDSKKEANTSKKNYNPKEDKNNG